MQYVEMIVYETIRMHPPVFLYIKKAGVDTPLVSSDLVIPAGANEKKIAMMTLKTVISKVIWNFRILPDETYEPQLLWGLTMGAANGMRIKLLKR
ncbi:CSON009071 protein [Gryllus bimaculatus]|nr:CSON009071 protein [Gryllus bimaculatus]